MSLFERKVEILADIGLHARVDAAEWRAVIARMTPLLARRRTARGAAAGLARVGEYCSPKGITASGGCGNELPDGRSRSGARDECSRDGCACGRAVPAWLRCAAPRSRADVPYLTGRVVDNAEILAPATRDSVDRRAQGARGERAATRSSC